MEVCGSDPESRQRRQSGGEKVGDKVKKEGVKRERNERKQGCHL